MARATRRRAFLHGAEELMQIFENMPERAINMLTVSTEKAAEKLLETVKEKVPTKTGALKRSYTIKRLNIKKTTRVGYTVYSRGKREGGVRYAFAVEGGTSKMKAQPHIRPAFGVTVNNMTKIISRDLNGQLEESWSD